MDGLQNAIFGFPSKLMANDVGDLATPISSLKLGAPTMQNLGCQ